MKKGKKNRNKIKDYPPELKGLAKNRFGGNQLQRELAFCVLK